MKASLKIKPRVIKPDEVFVLTVSGDLVHLMPGQRARETVLHAWKYAEVGADPGFFMAFLLDAKRRGASRSALRKLVIETCLDRWVTDVYEALGIGPKPVEKSSSHS